MDFLLKDLAWMSGETSVFGDVRIQGSIISAVGENLAPGRKDIVVSFKDHWLYPGLINGHDHLEMNLYPRLGNPPYGNYAEWGNDIYKPGQSPLLEIERVDINDRLMMGGFKNLISGATTVLHHNPRQRILESDDFPVKVPQIAWSHSVAFGTQIKKDFPKKKSRPYVIHAAEGTDQVAFSEIGMLQDMGLLRENTVLVHAIGLSEPSIEAIKKANASIVWCPASNMFLFNKTAPIAALRSAKIPIVIGSDSTLTGSPSLLDEMRFASQTGMASSAEILDMVTIDSAMCFNLPAPVLSVGSVADFFITPIFHSEYAENLQRVRPRDVVTVFVDGTPKLCNEAHSEFSLKYSIVVDGSRKNVFIDMQTILGRIQRQVDEEILSQNPLWKIFGV